MLSLCNTFVSIFPEHAVKQGDNKRKADLLSLLKNQKFSTNGSRNHFCPDFYTFVQRIFIRKCFFFSSFFPHNNKAAWYQRNLVVMTCGLSKGLSDSLRCVARGTLAQLKNAYSITALRSVRAFSASSSLLYGGLKYIRLYKSIIANVVQPTGYSQSGMRYCITWLISLPLLKPYVIHKWLLGIFNLVIEKYLSEQCTLVLYNIILPINRYSGNNATKNYSGSHER